MKLQPPTTETIKAKADRYYKAQCKRIADERKAKEHAFVIAHNALHEIAAKRGRPRKSAALLPVGVIA
jgi:hypothetical protein